MIVVTNFHGDCNVGFSTDRDVTAVTKPNQDSSFLRESGSARSDQMRGVSALLLRLARLGDNTAKLTVISR